MADSVAGASLSTRSAAGAPVAAWSVGNVTLWLRSLRDVVPADALSELLARVEDEEVDGEVFASLTESELGARSRSCVAPFGAYGGLASMADTPRRAL